MSVALIRTLLGPYLPKNKEKANLSNLLFLRVKQICYAVPATVYTGTLYTHLIYYETTLK